MIIGSGEFRFAWIEDFADIPDRAIASEAWSHNGMAIAANGHLLTAHPARAEVLELTTDGALVRSFVLPLTEVHGITTSPDDDTIWIADNGRKRLPEIGYDYPGGPQKPGRVVAVSPAGDIRMEIGTPDLPVYASGTFSPTHVAVWSQGNGGNGDIWIADGYGRHHVHRYDATGTYLQSINGEEGGAGPFNTPHAVWIDTRKAEPELYVTDRANNRIQVYTLDGAFKRSFGEDCLIRPSAFAACGDFLIVAELDARLSILDADDRLVARLGDNHAVSGQPGWPNMLDGSGAPARTDRLRDGLFNSPHGLAADAAGNVYVSEWLIGGRYIKLARQEPDRTPS